MQIPRRIYFLDNFFGALTNEKGWLVRVRLVCVFFFFPCFPSLGGETGISVDVGGESEGILAAVSAGPANASRTNVPSIDVSGKFFFFS